MVVVVIAGILLGPAGGALTGVVGTSLNASVLGTGVAPYEFAAIIPHHYGIHGRRRGPAEPARGVVDDSGGASFEHHRVHIIGLMPANQMAATIFSIGLAAEAVVDIVVIVLAVPLLRPLVREAAPA